MVDRSRRSTLVAVDLAAACAVNAASSCEQSAAFRAAPVVDRALCRALRSRRRWGLRDSSGLARARACPSAQRRWTHEADIGWRRVARDLFFQPSDEAIEPVRRRARETSKATLH